MKWLKSESIPTPQDDFQVGTKALFQPRGKLYCFDGGNVDITGDR